MIFLPSAYKLKPVVFIVCQIKTTGYYMSMTACISSLDLNIDTAWEFKFHKSVNCLRV